MDRTPRRTPMQMAAELLLELGSCPGRRIDYREMRRMFAYAGLDDIEIAVACVLMSTSRAVWTGDGELMLRD